jgi:hypothetical protein
LIPSTARENLEINGGDDVDDDGPIEPRPTRRDVLKAVSTIGKYTNEMLNRQLYLEETRGLKVD